MSVGAVVEPLRLARERLVCAGLTATAALLLLAFGPAPGDAAVHLYRTFLVRHGAFLWDNFWYAGHYPLASYSLLYYLPAAVIGNVPLVLGAAVLSTLLFASIARQAWGDAAVWPSRVFGICAAAPLFTGLYSYSVGFAMALGAIRALQRERALLAIVLAALALGFSPLAFAFLCLLLASIYVARRRLTPSALRLGIGIAVLAGFELLVMRVFPSGGTYPFHAINLAAVLGTCLLGVLLARHAEGGGTIAAFFAFWGVGSVAASVIASPIGDNWTRLNEFVFPLMLLTAALARFRPRWLAAAALAGALAYNITPYLLLIPYRLDNRPATARFWQPALQFLHGHVAPGYRVEVVPTAAHWESYWIPRDGFALARGFYQQLDMADNPVLYAKQLEPDAYRRWLRSSAVEYVLLPATHLDRGSASQEAAILRSGAAGLVVAYRSPEWTIYRLPHATPLITGPGAARVLAFSHTTISGTVSTPGTYLLRTHYIPFWQETRGVCIHPAADGMTRLELADAGRFSLTVRPEAEALLRVATGSRPCKDAGPVAQSGSG